MFPVNNKITIQLKKGKTYCVKVLNASFQSFQNIIPLLVVTGIRIQVTVVTVGGNIRYRNYNLLKSIIPSPQVMQLHHHPW